MFPNRLIHLTPLEEQKKRLKERGATNIGVAGQAGLKTATPTIFEGGSTATLDEPKSAITPTEIFAAGTKLEEGQTRLRGEPVSPFQQAIDQVEEPIMDRTPTQAREDIASQAAVAEKEFGLQTGDVAVTQTDIKRQVAEEDLRQQEFADAQEAEAKRLEGLGLRTAAESLRRQTSAARQVFGSREGAISTARAGLPSAFAASEQKVIDEAIQKIDFQRKRRVELERRRKNAVKSKNQSLIRDLDNEIRSTKIREQEAVASAEAASLTAQTAAQEQAQTKLDTILGLGEGVLATMNPDVLGASLEAANINPAFAGSIILAAQKLETARQKKDELATAQAQANLQKTIANISQIGVLKPTAAQQNFLALQKIQAGGATPSQLEDFRKLLGISDEEGVEIDLRIKTILPTGKLSSATFADREITLDSGALQAFSIANNASVKAGLGELRTDAKATASFRNDDTQKALYGKGRTVDELLTKDFSIEEANAFAKPNENVVTWTTESRHKSGMAIDLHQDVNYINSVKDFLKSEGWEQTLPTQDPAHFEFRGKIEDKITATDEVFITSLVKDVLGTRAVKDPDIINTYRQAFIENNRDRDALEDLVRLSGQSNLFSGSIRDAAEQISFSLSKDKKDTLFDSIDRRLGEDNVDGAREALKAGARASVSVSEAKAVKGSERLFELIGEIKNDLETFEKLGGDTGIFTGTQEAVLNKIGRTSDPKVAQIATKIQKTIQGYRQVISGAAFTESETAEYRAIFPSISKTAELNAAKIAALDDIISGDIRFFYETALGKKAYGEIFGTDIVDKNKIDLDAEATAAAPTHPIQETHSDINFN